MPKKLFQPGQSGNPGGRPKVALEFRAMCRNAVDEHVIAKWIQEVEFKGKEWLRASELLANYGYGKPSQPLEHTGAGGESLGIQVKFIKPGESK